RRATRRSSRRSVAPARWLPTRRRSGRPSTVRSPAGCPTSSTSSPTWAPPTPAPPTASEPGLSRGSARQPAHVGRWGMRSPAGDIPRTDAVVSIIWDLGGTLLDTYPVVDRALASVVDGGEPRDATLEEVARLTRVS